MIRQLTIKNENDASIIVALEREGAREVGRIIIDGVFYHLERLKAKDLQRNYRVDNDDDYCPQHDNNGKSVIVAPFSKK